MTRGHRLASVAAAALGVVLVVGNLVTYTKREARSTRAASVPLQSSTYWRALLAITRSKSRFSVAKDSLG